MSAPVVSYEESRSQFESGDIVFIRDRKSILANIIQFFTRSRYSHVGIAFWMSSGGIARLMMVEAQGGTRRRIVNLSKYRNIDLDVMKAPDDWRNVANEALERLSEVPYGYLEALYVGIVEALQQYFDVTIPRKNFKGEICSEFVARIYDMPSKHVSPQELMNQLVEAGIEPRLLVRG